MTIEKINALLDELKATRRQYALMDWKVDQALAAGVEQFGEGFRDELKATLKSHEKTTAQLTSLIDEYEAMLKELKDMIE
jgi:5'-deoxynucleotidase YfbR-like HD superfamily hydrolase